MKEKRTNVLNKIAEVSIIILTIVGLLLLITSIVNIATNATYVEEMAPEQQNVDGFVPPQTPTYEEYARLFGVPLVYNRNAQVIDFFVDPSIRIDGLLYTNDRGYIITQMTYVTNISGLSYYFEFKYIDGFDGISTITFNATDEFMLYVIPREEIVEEPNPDIIRMFETYFYDMSLGAYIGFLNYFENYAVSEFEAYYNAVLNKLGSTQFGQNMLLSIITAPYNVLDSFTLFEANGVNISMWNVLVTCIGIAMFIWFIKMFAGG